VAAVAVRLTPRPIAAKSLQEELTYASRISFVLALLLPATLDIENLLHESFSGELGLANTIAPEGAHGQRLEKLIY
jgi:hypothetical protein